MTNRTKVLALTCLVLAVGIFWMQYSKIRLATGLHVVDAYVIVATPSAKTGAAFVMVSNATATEDRLIAVTSDVANRIELHGNQMQDGVNQMREVDGGMVVPAGGDLKMTRGGLHVMMMGLTRSLVQGDEISMTLQFEKSEALTISVPVDLGRN